MGKYLKKPTEAEVSEKKNRKNQVLRHLWKWITVAVLLAVLLLNVFTHIFQIVHYNGTGMEPGLKGGQTLVIQKTQTVSQGDVIAFYYNNQILVRRVICTGGSQIEISEQGVVQVDSQTLDEPYLSHITLGQCNITFPYQVRTGTVFVMGDHRSISVDSRNTALGCVAEEQIVGKLIFRVWPLDGFGKID